MRRRAVAGGLLGLMVGVAAASRAVAGGWGVLTMTEMPEYVIAGEPFRLTFALRGHGRMLSSGLTAHLVASHGERRVQATASPAKQPGYYTASLVLPSGGEWTLVIKTAYGDRQVVRLPLQAIEPGARPPLLSSVQRGHRLFVAKGCATCHRLDGVESNHLSPVGPPLTRGRYQPEYLARVLADPAVAATRGAFAPWSMPGLELSDPEIVSLVAFLTSAQTSRAVAPGASTR